MADALMLGVSGLRGVVGTTLTPEVATRFAGTFGAWLVAQRRRTKGRPIVVLGRDGRAGGQALRNAAAAGLQFSGCDVLDLGVAMTPTVGVVTDSVGDAGMVITASHNPQQWNGLKLIYSANGGSPTKASASAPSKAEADAIIARFHAPAPVPAPAGVAWDAVGEEALDDQCFLSMTHAGKVHTVLKELGVLAKIRSARLSVVLDSVNASGGVITPSLLEELRVNAALISGEPTGLFPHPPEPIAAHLGSVGRAVKKHKAAVGFCQDPDADRLALIDEKGRFIGEEYTLVLAARALIELGAVKKGASFAVNLSTSRMIDDLAASRKLTVHRTAVGEANVVEAMKRRGCVLGGEGNGGVIWPEITYIRDSLGAIGLVLALLAMTKKPLSALVGEMPAYAIVKRKVDLARKEDAAPAVEKLAKAYKHERVDLQDGVRVDFDARSAWVHVRASNTEPIMRLIAEAPTSAAAEGLLDEVAGVIR